MTYDEFKSWVTVKRTRRFLRHDLKNVEVSFSMSCDANYTDERRTQMTEDEFIDWVIRKTYEKLFNTDPFFSKQDEQGHSAMNDGSNA
jgi:hypothetical protein